MFGADKDGRCNEWNAAMAKLTGWHREEVLHKMLLGEVFDSSNASCMLKDKDEFLSISILINSTLASDETENQAPFGFFERNGWYIECLLLTKRKENADGVLTGVSCILFFPCLELQHALHVQQAFEETTLQR
jgi:phytochrome A